MCQKTALIGIIKDMRRISGFLISLILSVFLPYAHAEETLLSKLENAYRSIIDAHGAFAQTSYIKDLDKTQKFRGKFFLKGDKLRWQYEGDSSQVIYLTKELLIVYDPANRQAIKSSFDSERYGQLPLALLSRVASLSRDFEVVEKSRDTLLLTPKSKFANISRIEITIQGESFPIKSMKLYDREQNQIRIDFYSVRMNTNLKDSLFVFTPKRDDTVISY